MTQAELFHKAINYLKDNFKDKIDLSFPTDLTSEKFTLQNLKQTWYPILIECLRSKADIKSSEQQPNFTNWSLNQKIFDYKQGHLDILAPLIKVGLVFNNIDHTNVDSFESVKFDDIAHSVHEYANRIGTQSNGIYINNRILLAIIQGTQVHYEHYFGNWDVYQQQQHINYLLDYNAEQFTSEFNVDANDTPHYLYTDVNGLITADTYTALITATQIYLAVQNGNTGNPKIITGNVSTELISDLNVHDIDSYGQNELVKAALVFNGCYVDDLEVNNAVPLFCDRFNISSNLDDTNNRKQFYATLFGVYHPNMTSKASISLVSHIKLDSHPKFEKPNQSVIQTFWIDTNINQLYILQLDSHNDFSQYIFTAPLQLNLSSNDFNQINEFKTNPLNGHTQTLIPIFDTSSYLSNTIIGAITGQNPDHGSHEQWDLNFKATFNNQHDAYKLNIQSILSNLSIPNDNSRTELALSPNHDILLFGAGKVGTKTIQNSYCVPLNYRDLLPKLQKGTIKACDLYDYLLSEYNNELLNPKTVINQYKDSNSYFNGKSLQGYGIDNNLNIYISCGKSPDDHGWHTNPPFLLFIKRDPFNKKQQSNQSADKTLAKYQRIDLGPDSTIANDDWYQYLIANNLSSIYHNNKAEILTRDSMAIEFENMQTIDTNETDHYACYLNIAYHEIGTGKTLYNNIYRLDWYDKFDE